MQGVWRVYLVSALLSCVCGAGTALVTVHLLGPTPPADQFKTISDGKKDQLTKFLESKQSRLASYEANVTEEPNIDKRGDHTHIGRIEFHYTVTKPEGESKAQYVNIVEAAYHFSTTEKKWIFKGCVQRGTEPKEVLLVTFPEVKAAFEK